MAYVARHLTKPYATLLYHVCTRYAFILNPAAGHGRAGRKRALLERRLSRMGMEYELYVTQGPDHAMKLAEQLAGSVHAVVAVGGDGTIREVGGGLIASRAPVPFGIVPLGTGNDLARSLKIPRSINGALQLLRRARPMPIDYGTLHWTGEGGAGQTIFINAVGTGFDAAVALASERFKRLPGKAAYLCAVPQVLRHWTTPSVRVTLNREGTPSEALSVEQLFMMTVANGTSSGGGIRLTPGASVSDGLLDVCLVRKPSAWRLVRLFPRALRGTHVNAPEVYIRTLTSLAFETETPLPVHADGEVSTQTMQQMEVRVVTGGLSILGPQ